MDQIYYIYILASSRNGTLYIGITNDIARRVWEHKQGLVEGFTKKYGVTILVHYESYAHPQEAIKREKNLKKWKRAWKLQLIEEQNPTWRDLYEDLGL
jgi:putative endonuclease